MTHIQDPGRKTLKKEDIFKYGTKDEVEFLMEGQTVLKETGEMGQHDIEKDGDWYEAAQTLKKTAQHISKLTNGMLKFKKVYPFDQYQGPYAQCEVLGHWGRLWFGHGGGEDPGYYILETPLENIDNDSIDGDVYTIAQIIRKIGKKTQNEI